MKLESFLSRLAIGAVLIASTGLALDAFAVPLFSAAAALFVMLITTGDYARGPGYAAAYAIAPRRNEIMPLAA